MLEITRTEDKSGLCTVCRDRHTSNSVEAAPGRIVYICDDCLEAAKYNFIWICMNC